MAARIAAHRRLEARLADEEGVLGVHALVEDGGPRTEIVMRSRRWVSPSVSGAIADCELGIDSVQPQGDWRVVVVR